MRPTMTEKQVKIMKLLGSKKPEDCDQMETMFRFKISETSYLIEQKNSEVTGLEAELASAKESLSQMVGKYIGTVEMVEQYEMTKMAKPKIPVPEMPPDALEKPSTLDPPEKASKPTDQ